MKKNIAVIGLGNLGKRHLQSLLNSKRKWDIYGIDNNVEVLANLRQMYIDKNNLKIGKELDIIPDHLDVVIIATSSNVRREIFEKLIECSSVEYIIFEKVLFQRVEDYYYVQECLEKNNIRAWINCPRREQPIHKKLYEEIKHNHTFEMHIYGGEWGLACNLIHMLDLIEWYAGATSKISNLLLENCIVDSKRKGFKEIYGSFIGTCGKCNNWSISCQKDSNYPLSIEIIGDYLACKIIEEKGFLRISYANKQWEEEEREFVFYYQSQMTQEIVERILDTAECNLPSFNESMGTHLNIIIPLIEFFEKNGMEEKGVCPIT